MAGSPFQSQAASFDCGRGTPAWHRPRVHHLLGPTALPRATPSGAFSQAEAPPVDPASQPTLCPRAPGVVSQFTANPAIRLFGHRRLDQASFQVGEPPGGGVGPAGSPLRIRVGPGWTPPGLKKKPGLDPSPRKALTPRRRGFVHQRRRICFILGFALPLTIASCWVSVWIARRRFEKVRTCHTGT